MSGENSGNVVNGGVSRRGFLGTLGAVAAIGGFAGEATIGQAATGRPTFVCNSHFPHGGLFTVAHCAAPRKMNGRDYEPATIMTHYESDYGAACRVEYPKDQVVTVVIPNLRCTKWQGFRGRIVESPAYPACRSQMEIAIDGDWRRLATEMEGFHTQIIYGDYLREIGYALKKLGKVEWQCYSNIA